MHSLSFIISLALVAGTIAIPLEIRDNSGNAYTGPGGHARGGSVGDNQDGRGGHGLGSLLNILSNNAGNGGIAKSGNAFGGRPSSNPKWSKGSRWGHGESNNDGNAYTGIGGDADGGSVNSAEGLINILSGNAGKGGDASSGDSVGGGADNYEKHSSHDNDCDC